MGFHQFGAEFFGTREVVDVDFEEMLQRFIGWPTQKIFLGDAPRARLHGARRFVLVATAGAPEKNFRMVLRMSP